MPMSRADKQARLDALRGELEQATTIILTRFSGLTVAQDFELRRQLRQAGARYRVIKNTLAERAAAGTGAAQVLTRLQGVHAIAYTSGDGAALARTLQKYAKDNPAFKTEGGVVEGQLIGPGEVAHLAAMPSRTELMARLLFLLQAPAQRLAAALAAVGRDTAVVLDQAARAGRFQSPA